MMRAVKTKSDSTNIEHLLFDVKLKTNINYKYCL